MKYIALWIIYVFCVIINIQENALIVISLLEINVCSVKKNWKYVNHVKINIFAILNAIENIKIILLNLMDTYAKCLFVKDILVSLVL